MTEKERKINQAVVEAFDKSKHKIMVLLSNKDLEVTGQFAKTLYRSVANRYTLS